MREQERDREGGRTIPELGIRQYDFSDSPRLTECPIKIFPLKIIIINSQMKEIQFKIKKKEKERLEQKRRKKSHKPILNRDGFPRK